MLLRKKDVARTDLAMSICDGDFGVEMKVGDGTLSDVEEKGS